MSLFSSFYTGTSGMNAQAKATSIVSNNIANLNTIGFKRSETAFYDIFANTGAGRETAGHGVVATKVARIDQQGGLQQTGTALDAGIGGNGFFPVKTSPYDTNSRFLYTRAGQFEVTPTGVNDEAYLRNANGFFLYGWRLDSAGNTSGGDLNSLVPIQINPGLTEIIAPTSTAQLTMNLDADEIDIDPHFLTAPYQQLPVSEQAIFVAPNVIDNSQPTDFSRTVTMYDSAGQAYGATFEFRKIVGPGAHATTTAVNMTGTTNLIDINKFPNINAGDTFTVTVGANSRQYIIGAAAGPGQTRIDTISDLQTDINTNFGTGTELEAVLTSQGQLRFVAADPSAQISFTENVGNPLTAVGSLALQPDPVGGALSFLPDSGTYTDQADFPAIGANIGAQHWWEVRVLGPADANGVQPELTKGLMNFGPDGRLNVTGDPILTIPQAALGANFNNAITVDLSGTTQFGGEYNVLVAEQDGAPLGERDGIEIRRGGIVTATYTNGQTVDLYRIPLATFVNANGMGEVTGTVYSETPESGEPTLNFAREGGAGEINAATVENSNVDLGSEFARLIVSQRAYSASSKVVSTIDQMTEYLAQLSR